MEIVIMFLLAPVYAVLMAPTMGAISFIHTMSFIYRDYKKPEQPDFSSGPFTNDFFKWLLWSWLAIFEVFVKSEWVKPFIPTKKNKPRWLPESAFEWNMQKLGIIEKIVLLIISIIIGIVIGVVVGPFCGMKTAAMLTSGEKKEADLHQEHDKLFLKTGRFSD